MKEGASYQLAVSEFTTTPWPFERDVERYAAHGLDAIEVCEFKLGREDYRHRFKRIAEAGLAISSVQTTVHSLFPDSLAPEPHDPSDRVGAMLSSIEKIGPHLPAGTPFVVITGAAPEGDCERVYEFAVGTLARLADAASAHGACIAFEPLNPILFHTDTALWGLDAALELVERVGHPSLGLCCDTWNVFQTPDLEAVIRASAGRIMLAQLSDWRRPRNNADRRSLGDGSIPSAPLIAALRATGYDRPYVIEIFSSRTLPDSLWNADMDEVIDRNVIAFERFWRESEARV
jgi:sugar phosphate isomerase/epimerase